MGVGGGCWARERRGCGEGWISTVGAVDTWLPLTGPPALWPLLLGPSLPVGNPGAMTPNQFWGAHATQKDQGLGVPIPTKVALLPHNGTWAIRGAMGSRRPPSLLDILPCRWMSQGCQALLPDAFPGAAWSGRAGGFPLSTLSECSYASLGLSWNSCGGPASMG